MEPAEIFWTATHIWIALAVTFIVLEVLTPLAFGFILVGLGALCAAGVAAYDLPLVAQLGMFAVVTISTLILVRPYVMARLQTTAHLPSRTEAVIGKVAKVTEAIDPVTGTGRILVSGEDWAAFCENPVSEGAQVKVIGADGIRLHVATI